MKQIKVQELTLENFKSYGSYQNLFDTEKLRTGEERESEFYPDLITMHLANTTPASISIAKVRKGSSLITAVEYHKYTCEGILPLDGDCIIFAGKSSRNLSSENLQAFRVPKGTFVKLNPGVIHGRQFVVDTDSVNVVILLPERTYGNDMEFKVLGEDEKVEVVL